MKSALYINEMFKLGLESSWEARIMSDNQRLYTQVIQDSTLECWIVLLEMRVGLLTFCFIKHANILHFIDTGFTTIWLTVFLGKKKKWKPYQGSESERRRARTIFHFIAILKFLFLCKKTVSRLGAQIAPATRSREIVAN